MRVRCPGCDKLLQIPDAAVVAARDRIDRERAETRKAAEKFLADRRRHETGGLSDFFDGGLFGR